MNRKIKYLRLFPAIRLFVLLITVRTAYAAESDSLFYSRRTIHSHDSNRLFLSINNTNFFKNNEYFNRFYEGYTAIGYLFQPMAGIQLSNLTRLEAGVHLLKFSGHDGYSEVLPLFRIHHHPASWLDIILGSLYGSLNHQLIEPLYEFDHSLFRPVESGIQFWVQTSHLKSDIWLDWQQFILWNDPFQEVFVQGTSTRIRINDPAGRIDFSVPLQSIISHHGGQINNTELHGQTLLNVAPGIELSWTFNERPLHKAGLAGYWVYYKALMGGTMNSYHEGYGIYPNLFGRFGWFNAEAGYWNAFRYIAPMGSYLFQSVSYISSFNNKAARQLLTARLTAAREYKNSIKLGVRTELYYDFIARNLDYTYGLYLICNRDFFIKRRMF